MAVCCKYDKWWTRSWFQTQQISGQPLGSVYANGGTLYYHYHSQADTGYEKYSVSSEMTNNNGGNLQCGPVRGKIGGWPTQVPALILFPVPEAATTWLATINWWVFDMPEIPLWEELAGSIISGPTLLVMHRLMIRNKIGRFQVPGLFKNKKFYKILKNCIQRVCMLYVWKTGTGCRAGCRYNKSL